MALVGFFDILGTREDVLSGNVPDAASIDFSGPVVLAACNCPTIRFAIFSDSVIISSSENDASNFLRAASFMYGQWYADLIFVRGGVAEGEINWLADAAKAGLTRAALPNLSSVRIYGKGLVLAYEIEQRSGLGAVTYLTENAAIRLRGAAPNSVLPGITPMLCWASEREALSLVKRDIDCFGRSAIEGPSRRHALATKYYWEQIVLQKKFLPDLYQHPGSGEPLS